MEIVCQYCDTPNMVYLVQTKLYQTLVMKLNVSLDFSAYIAQI